MDTFTSTRYGLVALVLLVAATVGACGPRAADDAKQFLIYDRSADSGDYELFERSIETIDNVAQGNGKLARLRAGGDIKVKHLNPQTKSEIANSMQIKNDGVPRIDYSVRDDGTVVPWDFHSTVMLTLYHHIEQANQYFRGVGVDKSKMGKVPVYYYARLQVVLPIDLLTDNAAYAFTLDAFLVPPQMALKDLPLAANRGVMVHEYSHLVFNRLVHNNARAPAYMVEGWPSAAVNRMRSIDEGVADIFAGLQTKDPNFIGDSISDKYFDIDRNLAKKRNYTDDLKSDVETDSQNAYNPYKLGSVIASTVWALRKATEISDDRLGTSVVETLRAMSGLGPDRVKTATFFNELAANLPSGQRAAACDVFTNRLDAIRGELSCDD